MFTLLSFPDRLKCFAQIVQSITVSYEHYLSGTATESDFKDLLNELEIMTSVGQHPNLVNLIGACSHGGESELNIEHPHTMGIRSF